MVRTIRSCSQCSTRFACAANDVSVCKDCLVSGERPRRNGDSDGRKPVSGGFKRPLQNFTPSTTQQSDATTAKRLKFEEYSAPPTSELHLYDGVPADGADVTDDIQSEGEDEFRCTQQTEKQEDVSSDSEEDDLPLFGLVNSQVIGDPVQKEACFEQNTCTPVGIDTKLVQTDKSGSGNEHNNDICFICGADLRKLKRRIDHIKRCSKRHSITGKDVKQQEAPCPTSLASEQLKSNAIVDLSGDDTTSSALYAKTSPNAMENPYTKPSSWHGDSSLALRLQASTQHAVAKTKQTSLASFVKVPIRNAFNALMAGSRRQSKTDAIVAQKEKSDTAQGQPKRRQWGKYRRDYSKANCPQYKKITGTDFVCDGFQYAKRSLTQNYFLTHYHSDHYGGITKSWDCGTIYCSLATANLVSQELGVDKKYIHPLPMNTPTVIASRGKPVTITLLDANHCPGAVMFLFEVGKRNILHVGDFRWHRDSMLREPSLASFFSNKTTLDEIFFDTTYCNSRYKLPSQQEAIRAVIDVFQKDTSTEKSSGSRTLHLFGAYTIGKEKMYLSVAEHFKKKVYVDPHRFRILSKLDWPKERMSLVTTNKQETSIWVVPLGHINMKKLPDYFREGNDKPFAKHYDRIIGYRPTGWSQGGKPSSSVISSRSFENVAIHSVPYSEHSSFPELVDCLRCLKPHRIIPTVNVSKSDEQISTLLRGLKEKQSTLPWTPEKR